MYHIFLSRHTPYKCSNESHTQFCLLPYRPLNDDNILFFRTNCVSFFNCVACDAICVSNVRETNFVVFASYFHMSAWKICTLVNAFIPIYTHMPLSELSLSLWRCLSCSRNGTDFLFNHYTLVWRFAVFCALAMYTMHPFVNYLSYAYKKYQCTHVNNAFQMRFNQRILNI